MARRAAKRARAAVATFALLIAATSCGGDPRPPAEDVARTPAAEPEHITIKLPRQGASVRATGGLAGSRRAQLSLRGTANDGTTVLLSGGCTFQGCESIARSGRNGRWSGRVWVLTQAGKSTAVVEASSSTSVEPLARLNVRLLAPEPATPEAEPGQRTRTPQPEQPTGSAAPLPSPSNTPVRRLVLVGDSLAEGIEPLLPSLLPGWQVQADAERSRPLAAGMGIVGGLDLSSPTALAISLFTNDDPGNVEGLDAAVRASVQRAGRDGCAIWATIVRPPLEGVSYGAANARLMQLQRTPSFAGRLLIVPWAQQVARHAEWIAGDGVHATPDGYRARARMYAQAALACGG
jgi:hypothetical protein